jgi:hypothetical protein
MTDSIASDVGCPRYHDRVSCYVPSSRIQFLGRLVYVNRSHRLYDLRRRWADHIYLQELVELR